MVIGGHRWSSVVIGGHRWSSVVIGGGLVASVVIGGHRWSSVVIGGHRWSSVVIGGHRWSSGWSSVVIGGVYRTLSRRLDDRGSSSHSSSTGNVLDERWRSPCARSVCVGGNRVFWQCFPKSSRGRARTPSQPQFGTTNSSHTRGVVCAGGLRKRLLLGVRFVFSQGELMTEGGW